MADRFCGTISIGGKVTKKQLVDLESLLLEEAISETPDDIHTGRCDFQECTSDCMDPLVDFCTEQGIELRIAWDAKYEFTGRIEYHIGGAVRELAGDNTGKVMFSYEQLAKVAADYPRITVAKFLRQVQVPDFPELEIEKD